MTRTPPVPTAAQGLLARTGWAGAFAARLAADASARSYLRLSRATGETAILMQAPVTTPAEQDSVFAFLRVGAHLAALGHSVPEVIGADLPGGLVLMEDFGDATLARLVATDPATARIAYAEAVTAMLPQLAAAPVPDWVAHPDATAQAGMIDLTLGLLPDPAAPKELAGLIAAALATHCAGPPVLALRDCHGDNLIRLPDRGGAARIGLLDFQDAVALPLGYDLASLLDDPRRDLPEGWRAELTARFAAETGQPLPEMEARLATLSLLRNLRILGIFHRLATQQGKPQYRAFVPRTGRLIDRAVAHPALAELRAPVAHLRRLTAPWADGVPA